MIRLLLITALALFASACATQKYCEREQDYQKASMAPPLNLPENATVPPADPSLFIPEVFGAPVPVVSTDADGVKRCLDYPPAYVGSPKK